jgi:O-antigen biosynthesis protein WbqV
VNTPAGSLDWQSFLARPRLPSPSLEALDFLYRKRILITGAGGTIGSALALRLGNVGPSSLLLLDTAESRLYDLQQAWRREGVSSSMTPILGNTADRALLDEIFTTHAPAVVFQAAVLKHVALMEEQPLAALATNVLGTLTITRAASAVGARVILLSSDKAVEPASVMGATKHLSERIVLAAGGNVLRVGNVLASRGSVTETFAQQIAVGQPLTITDPAARRHFLTLDEAVNLLMMAVTEPAGSLLAPEIGDPSFITDLAHFMARELAPESEVELDFTKARPGEKDPRRFWSGSESPRPAAQTGLLSIQYRPIDIPALESALGELRAATDARDTGAALAQLCELVPEYSPGAAVTAAANQRVAS